VLVARPLLSAAPGSPSLLNAVGGQLIPSAGPRDRAPLIRSRGAMRSVRIHQSARGRARSASRLRGQHIGAAVAWLRFLASGAAPPLRRASQRWQNPRDSRYTAQQLVSRLSRHQRASVHRHTRTLSNASSNRIDGEWGTPQGVGAVHRTSRRSRRETPVPAQNWQAALPKRWPSVRAHSRLEVQGCPSTRLGPQRRHSSKPRRQRLPIASEAARRRSNCARQPARGRGG